MNRAIRESGLFRPALARLALAGAVFIGVYSACNQYTASRTDVAVWMWEWERHLPFVPELVVPSLDARSFLLRRVFSVRHPAGTESPDQAAGDGHAD